MTRFYVLGAPGNSTADGLKSFPSYSDDEATALLDQHAANASSRAPADVATQINSYAESYWRQKREAAR